MRLVIDIECNGLINPTKIWVIVCKDIDNGEIRIFRNPTEDRDTGESFRAFIAPCQTFIGHNILGYDWPVLVDLLHVPGADGCIDKFLDTLIISRLVDYPRSSHSVEDYGEEFGIPKIEFSDFSKFSEEMVSYCIRDVEITEKIYNKYKNYLSKKEHQRSIRNEHKFQLVCNKLEKTGFALDVKKVDKLLDKVGKELHTLDTDILETFQPRLKLIKEVTPKATKYGTISLSSIPKTMRDSVHELTVDASFCYCNWVEFNPASPKQIIGELNRAGWSPIDKTKGHIETERRKNQLERIRKRTPELDTELKECYTRLKILEEIGWKVNETNLSTLSDTAPKSARLLAKRILYEARRRTLTEWKELVRDDGRVHGKFLGLGAWTHRMAHQKPNMANITNAVRVSDGKPSPLGKELRQSWIAPNGRLLVGVDAEAIQLRVFAHLINDPTLTDAIVNGNKRDGTDPHSLNKKYFGEFCKTRNAAKHSLYAMFFGGRAGKIAEIMDCNKDEAQSAIDALVAKYPGLQELQQETFPRDARRGYFIGLDGRKVTIPGETVRDREHLCMSGYLQNGEKVIMMEATLAFEPELEHYDSFLVDLVHDEWQTECPNDLNTCIAVAELECKALKQAGEGLSLNCPITGSYRNDNNEYTFGNNWYETH